MHLVADHSRISSACYAGLVPTAQIPPCDGPVGLAEESGGGVWQVAAGHSGGGSSGGVLGTVFCPRLASLRKNV